MANPKDFTARQIRTSQLIASGGIAGTRAGLVVYSASIASDMRGGYTKDINLFSGVGDDVYFFVSGSKDSKVARGGEANGDAGVTLFGGDVVFSGTMYADKMVVEVDLNSTGSVAVSGSLFVSRSIYVNEGAHFNISSEGDSENDFRIESATNDHMFFVDSSEDKIGIGTSTPSGKLEVEASDADDTIALSIDQKATGNKNALRITSDSGSPAVLMTVGSAGAIAIEAEGDTYGLDITADDACSTDPLVTLTHGAGATTSTTLKVKQVGTGDILNLFDGAVEVFTVTDGGNVGIGTDAPAGVLDVFGDEGSQVFILSGSGGTETSPDESTYTDLAFFVSGSIGSKGTSVKGTSVFGGDTVLSGSVYVSGSIISLQNTSTEIRFEGTEETATTNQGSPKIRFFARGVEKMQIAGGYGGAFGGTKIGKSGAGENLVIYSDNRVSAFSFTDQVLILSGGGATSYNESTYTDLAFFVSGTIGSKGTSVKGTSIFGGDLHVSGNISVEGTAFGWVDDGAIVRLETATDKVGIGTSSPGGKVEIKVDDSENLRGLFIDHDETGAFAALEIDSEASSAGALQILAQKGLYVEQDIASGYGAHIRTDLDETGDPLVYIEDAGTSTTRTSLKVRQDGTGDILNLFDGATEVFTVTSVGNVGISQTSPDQLLHVYEDGDTDTVVYPVRLEKASDSAYNPEKGFGVGIQFELEDAAATPTVAGTIEGRWFNATTQVGEVALSAYDGTNFKDAVVAVSDRVLILSGGGPTDYNESTYTDLAFFVSGSIGSVGTDVRGASVFGGDVVISGSLYGGSPLSVGSDLVVSGTLITSGSSFLSGSSTISGSMTVTGSLTVSGSDTFTVFGPTLLNAGGASDSDIRMQTANKTHAFFADTSTDQVFILSGSTTGNGATSPDESDASDLAFFVSGSVGSRGTSVKGTSLFGGDLVISGSHQLSGSLFLGMSPGKKEITSRTTKTISYSDIVSSAQTIDTFSNSDGFRCVKYIIGGKPTSSNDRLYSELVVVTDTGSSNGAVASSETRVHTDIDSGGTLQFLNETHVDITATKAGGIVSIKIEGDSDYNTGNGSSSAMDISFERLVVVD